MRSTLKERIQKHQWKRQPKACWQVLERPLEPGEVVLACPILKDCSNPNHISVGKGTSIGDRVLWKKGQRRRVPKEKLPIERKLSDEQVRQIFLSTEQNGKLAEHYGVSKTMVINIRNGKRYRRVTESLIKGVTE
jgi:hypothetical protein